MKQPFLFRLLDPREAGGGDNDPVQDNQNSSPSGDHDEESGTDASTADDTESADENADDVIADDEE